MTQFQMLETLAKVGAIITNSHIVYTSGRHGDSYVNKDAIYPHTDVVSTLCERIAREFLSANVEAVAAPAVGGVILSQWTAHHLSRLSGKPVVGVYAEKEADSDKFVLKRGYDKLITNRRVLILEDVLTTGGSVKKVVEICEKLPAQVVGIGALCNRGNLSAEMLGVKNFFALVKVDLGSWEENDCPLCKNHVPINVDVGKGREFIARRQNS